MITEEELNQLIEHSQLFCKLNYERDTVVDYFETLAIQTARGYNFNYITVYIKRNIYIFKDKTNYAHVKIDFYKFHNVKNNLDALTTLKKFLYKLKLGNEMFNLILKNEIKQL